MLRRARNGGRVLRLDTGCPPCSRPGTIRGPARRELDDVGQPHGLLRYWGVANDVQWRAYLGRASIRQEEAGQLCGHPYGTGEIAVDFPGVPAAFAAAAAVAHG